MYKRIATILVAGIVSVGCTPVNATFQGSDTVAGNATLELKTQVVSGGLTTQSIVNNYTASSINHLTLKLLRVNGNTELPVLDVDSHDVIKDIDGAHLADAVVFSKLGANATYRIRAYAYKAAGSDESNLISTSDANSYIDVTLTNNDRPTLATLRVKLQDVVFSGEATSSGVSVTNGGYVTTAPESIH